MGHKIPTDVTYNYGELYNSISCIGIFNKFIEKEGEPQVNKDDRQKYLKKIEYIMNFPELN